MNTDREPEEDRKPLAPGLYLVATPIGNLEDITLRALRVLRSVDRIACEDTRQTQKLLNHFAIRTPTVSYHMHNEAGRATELAVALKAGARIAVVSDAGTPGISDPGGQIAAAAIAAGVPVFPVPGANAAISALVASGLAGEAFTFHGFLPAKEGQRRTALEALKNRVPTLGHANDPAVVHIFYEAPHRILDTLADVEAIFGPAQDVVVARELTKLHEEFLRGAVSEVRKTLADRDSVRGEIVLLFAPSLATLPDAKPASTVGQEVRYLIKKEGLTEKDALKRVARARNMSKSEAYRELQRERGK
jgi:16S rRNA (cytidine1402-2'-O)-methyltransferase